MKAFLLLPLLLAAPAVGPAADEGERISLEELLARYRAERDTVLGELRDRVQSAIAELDAQEAGGGGEAAFARLMKLGMTSAPLLAPALDPGPAAAAPKSARGRLVAEVLREYRSPAITDALLEMLKTASSEGRRNVLRVLAATPDPERVGPEVRAFYAKAKGEERRAALEALAEVGGAENEDFLGELLASEDREVAGFALRALASAGRPEIAPRVLALVRDASTAARLVSEIVAYYEACPDVVDGDHCEALLALVRSRRPTSKDNVILLELLPDFERQWPSSMKKELRQVADSGDREVAEAALVALTIAGDRGAKRDLLEPYDQRIAEQRNWGRVYQERADVLYRIEDFKGAVKDYREALRLGRDTGGRTPGAIHVQIARCYARMDKPKDAHEWLETAPISVDERRALAADPAFAELVESSRYRDVFRLE